MKRLVALLLICLYLPGSSGATITVHYCMGKQIGVEVSAYAPDSKKCSNCGMIKENRKGCCNDKQETIRLSNDQLLSAVNDTLHVSVYDLQNTSSSLQPSFINPYLLHFHSAHSPPFINTSSCILHCVFRI